MNRFILIPSILFFSIIAALAQEPDTATENRIKTTVQEQQTAPTQTTVAEPERSRPSSNQQKNSGSGTNMYVSITGAIGMSYPMGDIAGDGGQEGVPGKSMSAGILYGYRFFSIGSAYFKISYAEREIITDATFMNQDMRSTLQTSFIDFTFAYRGFYSLFYYDAGFYYGVSYGNWSREVALNGTVTETHLHGSLESRMNNEVGFLLGGGVLLAVTENISIQFGIEFNIPFTGVYSDDEGNDLSSFSTMIRTGVVYNW